MIDTHAHLDELQDIDTVLGEAKDAGVISIIAVGQDIESNTKTLAIARQYKGYVFPAIGYHPWKIETNKIEQTIIDVSNNIKECVALGEIGLDYRAKVKKNIQKQVFCQLLEIAAKHDKPVIVHSRYSHQTTFDMVLEYKLKKAVFHWYNGPLDVLKLIISEGYHVSASPALLYNPHHEEAMAAAPLSNILVETDTPVNYRGLSALPKDVRITVKELARVRHLTEDEIAEKTMKNAKSLFGI
ncbi:MAG: TatD family hydrolase [Pseudomonadota bacterium]